MQHAQDWIDGFLVVGNQPVMDLLNTRLVVDEQPHELLPDTSALVRWIPVSGLVSTPGLTDRLRDWNREETQSFLEELVDFRESLRSTVLRLEDGKQPAPAFLADLNARLLLHPWRAAILNSRGILEKVQAQGTSLTDTIWAALLEQTLKLLTEADRGRLRKCESCVVHFHDTSKKNARRWCSMRLCGNRIKVAAYQGRRKSQIAR
jgi:predicted RNA-binding Zn ribbon-like protein